MFERITLMNYGTSAFVAPLRIEVAADFRDMFEVRGQVRAARGKLLDPEASLGPQRRGVQLRRARQAGAQVGHRVLATRRRTWTAPRSSSFCSWCRASSESLFIEVGSEPGAPALARTASRCGGEGAQAHAVARPAWCARAQQRAAVRCLDATLARGPGAADERAGNRAVSVRGHPVVLDALRPRCGDHRAADPVARSRASRAACSASSPRTRRRKSRRSWIRRPARSCTRRASGEMSALRELPFGRYYGGVDTTPLFVMLAGAYARRTGDAAFVDTLWPALLAATGWIERVCDANPRRLPRLCARRIHRPVEPGLEGQRGLGLPCGRALPARARSRSSKSRVMRTRPFARWPNSRSCGATRPACKCGPGVRRACSAAVEAKFWMEDQGFYGIAVDGDGALCAVRSSNPGPLVVLRIAECSARGGGGRRS